MGMVFQKSGRFFGTSPRIKRAVYLLAMPLYRQNCAKMAKIAQSESTSHFKRFLAFHVFHVRCKILSVHLFQNKKLSVRFRPKLTIFVTAASSSQSNLSPRKSSASRSTSHPIPHLCARALHRVPPRTTRSDPSRLQTKPNDLFFIVGQSQMSHRIIKRHVRFRHHSLRQLNKHF